MRALAVGSFPARALFIDDDTCGHLISSFLWRAAYPGGSPFVLRRFSGKRTSERAEKDNMATIGEVKQVGIELLIPYVNNAKKHSDEQVAKIASSIREFGFVNPVLIDKDYNIIAGHGRVMAARKLKLTEVPCVFIEGLTETQRKAYILADNRLGELADWDMELVGLELDALDLDGFDTSLTGFDLFGDDEPAEVVEDDVPDVDKMEVHYGVPYQGNKSRIADKIISVLPSGERLVDLFGGGGGDYSLRNSFG